MNINISRALLRQLVNAADAGAEQVGHDAAETKRNGDDETAVALYEMERKWLDAIRSATQLIEESK